MADKSTSQIPVGKVARATRFARTGVKVGGNYIKHYAKKMSGGQTSDEELHAQNAKEVYDSLSELKGSALKVAQMMSMDQNFLPKPYADKFKMAQNAVPPLSGPLVMKTLTTSLGRPIAEVYDSFNAKATYAASIGQVHEAYKGDQKLAVKIQYPGVGDSITSDLRLVKPMAVRVLGLQGQDLSKYFEEVETRLKEETDYHLELKRGQDFARECSHIEGLEFPEYYPEMSSGRVITMSWLEGLQLDEFMALNPSQEQKNQIGQIVWDFYDHQIHTMRKVQADPHPGNFLFSADGSKLGVLDFGCVKVIPDDFYNNYFKLLHPNLIDNKPELTKTLEQLEVLLPGDSPQDKANVLDMVTNILSMLGRPFHQKTFDFGDRSYFEELVQNGEQMVRKGIAMKKSARGAKDAIYINRSYFGLYSLLNQLGACISTRSAAIK